MPIPHSRRLARRTAFLAVGSLLAYGCADGVPTGAVPAGPSTSGIAATAENLATGGSFEAVNATGWVVGTYSTATADSALVYHPVERRKTLPTLDAASKASTSDRAHAVNAAGWIVGESNDRNGAQRAVLWTSLIALPQDLGSLRAAGMSWAYDVNAGGTVVGAAEASGGVVHAFTWTSAGGMVDISPTAPAAARALNDSGVVVGSVVSGGQTRAFVWRQAGGMLVLPTLGGNLGEALDVNRSGAVVGRARNAAGQMRAFRWTAAGGVQDLGTLGGTTSVATGIDEAGMVVGYSTDASGRTRPFAWTSRAGMRDLASLGHPNASAFAVSGQRAVGTAVNAAGTRFAIRWKVNEVNTAPTVTLPATVDTVVEGSAFTFAPQWSDAEGDPLQFTWRFGDATELNVPATLAPAPVQKTYRDQGTYAVQLIVADPSAKKDTATQTVVVVNRAPTGTFNPPAQQTLFEGMQYVLGVTGIFDGAADLQAGIQLSFSCGYGVFGAYSSAMTRTCTGLPDQDTMEIAVRLRDKDGAETLYTRTQYVVNDKPVVSLAALSAATFAVGGTFNARGSMTDRGSQDGPWKYVYAWGDGSSTQGSVNAQGTLPQAAHAYAAPGSYAATVTVTDKDGKAGKSSNLTVTVTP
jgi:probable HAF family extracellular repeat protein